MKVDNKQKDSNIPLIGWEIIEDQFVNENNYRNETLFSLGNGYIGLRGNFEEGNAKLQGKGLEGTYLNGFYEKDVIKYGEIAYGYPEYSQTMLNVTNAKIIQLFIDSEEFCMYEGELEDYCRVLSLKEGVLKRRVIWKSVMGKRVMIEIHRLVSLKYKNVAVIRYEIIPLNFHGRLRLISKLDGNVTNLVCENDPRVGTGIKGKVLEVLSGEADQNRGVIVQKTEKSNMSLACAMVNRIETKCKYTYTSAFQGSVAEVEYCFHALENEKIILYKYISYIDSREFHEDELASSAIKEAGKACAEGYERLAAEQKDFLDSFWYRTDVEIKGDPTLQQGIRFNMFHLLQSVGRDGRTNIGAKGLTGEGYEGHYFWDTETYILPVFLYNNPEISRKLLECRYNVLDKARERARQVGHTKGALFPWRTINGEECSANYPSGTAQYHIDADVAFAVKRYFEATLDEKFLLEFGAEILFETARLWADLGQFIPAKGGKFCINGVTGPDEYNAVINNNCFTNLMAKVNMEFAHKIVLWMETEHSEEYGRLVHKIALSKEEPAFWKKAADNMFIPYDNQLKIHLQDDEFLNRAPWDFENTQPENYPLLLHYHPLVIYRHQVCKQADLVLALLMLGDQFTLEEKKRDYDFYEKCTTHDSSLSTSIFSIMASEIGYACKAYNYFTSTARMDLDDMHGNTRDGIHAANMAGTWMCVVNGFAGMRNYSDILCFNPYLPANWESYRFKILYRGGLLDIMIEQDKTVYTLLEGGSITFIHNGTKVTLKKQGGVVCPNRIQSNESMDGDVQ